MIYNEMITLKNGRKCILRNGTEQDGQALLDIYILTHSQTDYLLSYPDENTMTDAQRHTLACIEISMILHILSTEINIYTSVYLAVIFCVDVQLLWNINVIGYNLSGSYRLTEH